MLTENTKVIESIFKEGPRIAGVYCYTLAPEKYEDAPQRKDQHFEGQKPPVPSDYKSPFLGKTVEDVAKWMRKKPESVNFDDHHFVLLDKRAEKDGTVIVCRIGGMLLDEPEDLDYMRKSAFEASAMLQGMNYAHWEEREREPGKPEIEY